MSLLRRLGGATGRPTAEAYGTYAEWTTWLAEFGRGENPDPARLRPVAPTIGQHAMGRLADHAVQALSDRLRRWMDDLGRSTGRARSLDAFRLDLQRSRERLAPIVAFAHHPSLPDTLGRALQASVRDTVAQLQDSMETQLRTSPVAGARPMLLALRQAPFTALTSPPLPPPSRSSSRKR